jgi:uncharacterized membrane protein YcaP (DUF421 family)
MIAAILLQAVKALGYYALLVLMMRIAGKRLAGQTTTFDLLVLISLSVVLQTTLLEKGPANAAVFVLSVFTAHRALAAACARSTRLRHLVRGAPRPLVTGGMVLDRALAEESITREELLAGLRKLGFADPADVEIACLEETGHISAVGRAK